MRFLIQLIINLFFCLAANLFAADVKSHWPEGQERTYQYKMGTAIIGTQTAKLVGTVTLPGHGRTYYFDMKVNLDMSSVGQSFKMDMACSLFCSLRGLPKHYYGEYHINREEVRVTGDIIDDRFVAHSVGGGVDTLVSFDMPPGTFLVDNNFVAQWQLMFANLELTPGDTHSIDILIPQALRRLPMKLVVLGNETIEVNKREVECTVSQIDFVNSRFYTDSSGKLMRVVDSRQSLIIDLLPEGTTAEDAAGGTFWSTFHRRLLICGLFAVWVSMLLVLLGRRGIKNRDYWLLFAVSGAAFALVVVVQAPIQHKLSRAIFSGIGSKGSALYLAAFVIALVSGIFQETLKAGLIWLRWYLADDKPNLKLMIGLGAAAGAGFGFVESCWLTGSAFATGVMGFVSLPVWERIITTIFHVSTGVLLGYGIGRRQIWQYWLLAASLHTFGNFSIVFWRQGFVDAYIFEGFLTIFYLVVLVIAVQVSRRIARR
ncbi:MAG: hypothetical protein ABIK83_16290 [Candidatus Zixiibacteriota bacterium]